MTPLTTRLTVPVGDGVSGLFATFIDVSSAMICAVMIIGKARYASGRLIEASNKRLVPVKSMFPGWAIAITFVVMWSSFISSRISKS